MTSSRTHAAGEVGKAPQTPALPAADSPAQGDQFQSEGALGWLWIGLTVAVGLALRIWEGSESSLWLDELHTLFHASRPDVAGVLSSVRPDNHTPLFFLAVHALGDWSDGAQLRALPILSSFLALPFLLLLLRDLGAGRTWTLVALWFWATFPYQVHYAAELRPYAWLGPWSLAAFWFAFSERGSAWGRFAGFAACAFLGLLTHMAMAITILAIGCARLCLPRGRRLTLGSLVLAGSLAVAGFLPWLIGFAERATDVRFDYQEEHGGYTFRPTLQRELLALPLRLIEPYISWLGHPWARVAGGATLVFLTVIGLALSADVARRVRAPRPSGSQTECLRGLLIFALAAFVLVTGASWYAWDRVPLQYYVGVAWVAPALLAGWLAGLRQPALRRCAVAVACLASLAMGVALAAGRSREDVRAGVALLRAWGAELEARDPREAARPFYTARMAQPAEVFDEVLPFLAYAPDLGAVEPEALPKIGEPGFQRPVLVYRRVLALDHRAWKPILTGREIVRERVIDRYVSVYELRPKAALEPR